MPVVTFQAGALRKLMGREMPTQEIADTLPLIGGECAGVEGEAITMEWFPNRPDLLTVEGAARALAAFTGHKPGLRDYSVGKPVTELKVDPKVAKVRPFAALCIVRGVPFDAALVQSAIDAQEKLTLGPGRKRKKVAIGIHDAAGVKGPFTYTAVAGDEHPFIPLATTEPMTPAQVMERHPKGKEYGHLVPTEAAAGKARYPMFLDATGKVLSLPPVINAQSTAVTERTRDVILDVTGTDARAVRQVIALLATALADRGGRIEPVTVHDASGTWTCPDLKPSEHVVHTDDVAGLLGLQLDGEATAKALQRMGHRAEAYGNKVHVHSPAWRFDLLHAVDLVEDVAVGHGFDRFPNDLPKQATFGGRRPKAAAESRLRALLIGHGWHEARTLTLSNEAAQWGHWGAPARPAVKLRNAVLQEQTLLRRDLVPGLLQTLAANRHRSLPQRLFELGECVAPQGTGAALAWKNELHCAGAWVDAKVGFADVKGLVEALVRDAGMGLKLEPSSHAGLVAGRQCKLTKGGFELGGFGELHPDTLVRFGLAAPGVVFELLVR